MLAWPASATILIADDSPEQIALIRRVLESEQYRCIAVANGRAAIEACRSSRIDVALLDMEMPICDGLSACRELKAREATALTAVLLMTGNSDPTSQLAALEAGADDFLPKPLALAELRARVRSAVRMKQCIDELDKASAAVIMLGAAIEARDPHTKGHCERLALQATRLGSRIGLDPLDMRALAQGAYLHDLGKVGIPDAILFKPGPLTGEEFELIKSHPIVGDQICAPLRTLGRARAIIRWHHERLDGTGYPDGLRGSCVPLIAQITAIADVYDALVTDRPYRRALGSDAALSALRDEALHGARDIALVDEFAAIIGAASTVEVPLGGVLQGLLIA